MATGNPLVSIIVPVYGTEKYLPSCVDSLLSQTHSPIEVVLVDDQSPDACPAICDEYAVKDGRVRVIHQTNKGVSGARNTGIEAATGEYFCFVDSDDLLEPHAVETLLKDISEYSADMASAAKSLVQADGSVKCDAADGLVTLYEGDQMLRRSLAYGDYTRSLHGKLLSAELIRDVRFAEGHNINEDGYFLFECYKKMPRVVHRNVSVYRYFYREGSASNSRFSEKYFDMLYFCDLKKRYVEEQHPALLEDACNMEVRTHLLFLQVLCRTNDKKYREAQRASVKVVRRLRRYHRPVNRHHRRLEKIVAWGLFPLYKKLIRLRYS